MSDEVFIMPPSNMPPIKIAFIIDNKVVDILHTDERLAAIFLSEPLIVDVTGQDGQAIASVDDLYDPESKAFYNPNIVEED